MSDPVSGYCDYLDKEMTIMGLLSAFAVGVPAAVLDRTAGASSKTALAEVWTSQPVLLGAGSLAFILAALFFYRQRSLLAFYLGQLRFSQTEARYKGMTPRGLLEDADSWATWVHYQTAFVLLTLGFILYGFSFYAPALLGSSPGRAVGTLSVIAALYCVVNSLVMRRYRYHDRPWVDWLHSEKPIGR